jgi:hypothetical protein
MFSSDGSDVKIYFWVKGNPSNKTDHNYVQMSVDSSPIGQWTDQPCNRKGLVVCQKLPTVTTAFLHKKLLENQEILSDARNQLIETTSRLNKYLKNLSSDKWINYKLFTDTDGKNMY